MRPGRLPRFPCHAPARCSSPLGRRPHGRREQWPPGPGRKGARRRPPCASKAVRDVLERRGRCAAI
eukprot:12140864-Alexandrium_andersonii.AAC.1